ncbi:MAG: minichromosome maintenance protein MCM, partial [Nitrososphaerota archaeon]
MFETIEEKLLHFFKQEKYRELFKRALLSGRNSIPVDFQDLLVFDMNFAEELYDKPLANIPLLNQAALKIIQIEGFRLVKPDKFKRFYCRVRGLPETLKVKDIRSEHLHHLIQVDGIVVRASNIQPVIETMTYKCMSCGSTKTVKNGESVGSCETLRCRTNPKKSRLEPVIEEAEYVDQQVIGLQEKPENLPPGQLPRTLEVVMREDLVDTVTPGDRCIICGILLPKNANDNNKNKPSHFYLDAVSVETMGKDVEHDLTPAEEEAIKTLAANPEVYQLLIDSIAPSIKGMEHVKEAALLALFGGRRKTFPDGVKVRGDVHVLLVGDPGTAKSTLLLHAAQIAPRGVYTSGRGSTAAGLTAAVVKEANGGLVLEAGACVLADMGICVIDEIDKMKPEDRVAMHELMAQQTVSIAKGGIVATLNARCSILAAANPELGRYDLDRPFNENVNLPITLLSRFDLIFVLRDEPSPEADKIVSSHIVSLHVEGGIKKEPPIPPNILKKYIAYSKKIEPVLTQE